VLPIPGLSVPGLAFPEERCLPTRVATAIEIAFPDELFGFELPIGVDRRLHHLLAKQDEGIELTAEERAEAEGLVTLAERLTLLKLRARRIAEA
jgi:hypothetical protein